MDKEAISIPNLKYIKCSREALKRLLIKSAKDPVGYFRQMDIETSLGIDANGKPLKYDDKMPVFLEY